MASDRNTEMVKSADIVDWLRRRRDAAAVDRKLYFDEIQHRNDAVKEGSMHVEEAAELNRADTIAANEQDMLALRYFMALTEIERGRKIIGEMSRALRERGCYVEGR